MKKTASTTHTVLAVGAKYWDLRGDFAQERMSGGIAQIPRKRHQLMLDIS